MVGEEMSISPRLSERASANGPTRREWWAWCSFDFANSAYPTIIVTVAYSIYFTSIVAPGPEGAAWWGRGYALSMLLVGLCSPFLGALADVTARKKWFLAFFTLLCVGATGALVVVGAGDLALGVLLLVLSNIGFAAGLTYYNAFLTELTDRHTYGRLSGYGWGLGYLGGMTVLILILPLIRGGLAPENLPHYRLSFVVAALFFALFSLPVFLWLRERAEPQPRLEGVSLWRMSVDRVKETLGHLRRYRQLTRFFVSYLIYEDGVNTVFVFAAIFASAALGLSPQQILIFFIVANIASGLGAVALGHATDWMGPKQMIALTLVGMVGVVAWAAAVHTAGAFYAMGVAAGILLGANQSASRVLLAHFTPPKRSAEFFGFFSLTGKFAAVLGPLLYGEIAARAGSHRLAVLSIGLFFIVGLGLLLRVDEREGAAAAK
jgi:UMF1 family MFS transporter